MAFSGLGYNCDEGFADLDQEELERQERETIEARFGVDDDEEVVEQLYLSENTKDERTRAFIRFTE